MTRPAGPDPRGIYFNSALLREPTLSYVCWLDVMGTSNQMLRSLPIAANFVFKLHCAVLEAFEGLTDASALRLYPVMDGVYITSSRRGPLSELLRQALARIATTFVREPKPYHQFLTRGAIAYGPVFHGANIANDAAYVLANHREVRDSILLGLPMAQAYREERLAPPFGVAVHDSARAFAPDGDKPFPFVWLDWFRNVSATVDTELLLHKLDAYFTWQRLHSNMTGYDTSRIAHHHQLAIELFKGDDGNSEGNSEAV